MNQTIPITHSQSSPMSDALRRKLTSIRALLARANIDEALTRAKIGRIILSIQADENKYGTRAVSLVAQEVGRDEATLYRYATVAARWDVQAFAGALRRKNRFGEPLSWSHFVELAAVEDSSERARLMSRALEEGLSVRALQLETAAAVASSQSTPETLPVSSRLRRLIAVCESFKGRVHWDDTELPVLPTGETLSLLDRALASQTELQEICSRNLERLRTTRQRVAVDLSRRRTETDSAVAMGSGVRLLAGYARRS